MITPMGMVNAKSAMMSEKWVSKSPVFATRKYSGMMITTLGIICPNKRAIFKTPCPLNLYRLNP